MIRRVFLKILTSSTVVLVSGLTTPIRLLAEWNESAFSAKNIDSAINSYFPNKEIKRSDRIKVEIYDEVENGAVVPVKINTDLENVKTILYIYIYIYNRLELQTHRLDSTTARSWHDLIHHAMCMDMHRSTLVYIYIYI